MKTGFIQRNELKKEVPLVDVKFTHSLCIGQTGSGKTTSFIYPNLLNRMKLGHGILFFDIKGSEHNVIKKLAKDSNRLDDVIEIGKPWARDINIIENFNSRTFNTLLVSLIGDPKGAGANAYFYLGAMSLGLSIYNVLKIFSIVSKEIGELDGKINHKFKEKIEEYKTFTLQDIHKASTNIDSVYNFIQNIKEIKEELHKYIIENVGLFNDISKKDLFKNISLNYTILEAKISAFKKYDIPKEERIERDKFDPSLIPVIHSLNAAFGFMHSPAAKYISNKENPLDIVKSLQEGKILVINVRVIPDSILELMLDQAFEKLIDLNTNNKSNRKPISIFIDEAQRLVNKNIPLDVLRSSQVDVLMAVQSEVQLISKFRNNEDWQQISVNISEKIAFKSSLNNGDSLNSFFINTAILNTFEYVKEYENNKKLADPIFINTKELEDAEVEYQNNILKLKDLDKNEIYKYDVTHFENEREVVIYNIKTKQKRYKKIFTKYQEEILDSFLEKYIVLPYSEFKDNNKDKVSIKESSWKKLYNNGINNNYKFNDSYHCCLDNWIEVFNMFIVLSFKPFVELCLEFKDQIEFDDNDKNVITNIKKKTLVNKLKKSIIEDNYWMIIEENGSIYMFCLNDNYERKEFDDYELDF